MISSIALTGATGFIGQHVLHELMAHDISITVLTRSRSKLNEYKSRLNIIEGDIACSEKNMFKKMGSPDVLLHLAWDGLPNYKSLHHFETELPLQYAFLRNLLTDGLKELVVTGTCFEYGMEYGPLSESTPTCPSNPYGFAKDTLRKQLQFYRETNPFRLAWVRLFYLYGRGQSENSLWAQLSRAVLQRERTFKMSGGEQLRDYLPVETVAKLLVSLTCSRKDFGIVNICSGKPISIRRIVEKWIEENRWTINLDLGQYPYPDYEPMAFWGDNRKLTGILEEK